MAKKRILIVEDEAELAGLVKMRLESAGYEAINAYDGKEGLEKARSVKPDLIILDVMMPVMNGYDVCRKLRVDSKYRDIPIIMFTVKFQPNDIEFGKEMGADAYITKPFESKVLLDKIKELLG